MKQIIIVDPISSDRASISHQLSQLQNYKSYQVATIPEALKAVDQAAANFAGFVVSVSVGMEALAPFVNYVQTRYPDLFVVAVVASVTLDQMKNLIGTGADQILVRPFSANQLKDKIAAATSFRLQVKEENLGKPTDSRFDVKIENVTGHFYKAQLSGWLGEGCQFPDFRPQRKDSTLFVDCNHLMGMNSVGVRLWMLWFKTLIINGFLIFEFENLHPTLLNQASVIIDFIPKNGSVNSFYLYYWNEDLHEQKEFRFARGKDFATDKMRIPKLQSVERNGRFISFELDVELEGILRFYKGRIEST